MIIIVLIIIDDLITIAADVVIHGIISSVLFYRIGIEITVLCWLIW